MNILVYKWGVLMIDDILACLKQSGISYQLFQTKKQPRNEQDRQNFMDELAEILQQKHFDAVFSINFFSAVSCICSQNGIPYIIWSYDSPAISGTDIFHDTNYFFLFDSKEVAEWKRRGLKQIYHLPLAVNTKRLDKITTLWQMQQKYKSEISFVGQLYATQISSVMNGLSDYTKSYLQAVIDMQMRMYNVNIIKDLITENFVQTCLNEETKKKVLEFIEKDKRQKLDELHSGHFQNFMNQSVTCQERVMLLGLLSKRHQLKLYSYYSHKALQNVQYCGTADYYEGMPRVFRFSNINLNVTIRNIEAGVPLRCLDIMGCGGFLLSNYQMDFQEYFENDKDMVWYESLEEAVEKADFYLKHEDLRKKIAYSGYQKVKECCSFQRQMGKIWEVTGLKKA